MSASVGSGRNGQAAPQESAWQAPVLKPPSEPMRFSFSGKPGSSMQGLAKAAPAGRAPAAGAGFSMTARKQQMKPAVAGFGLDSDDEG